LYPIDLNLVEKMAKKEKEKEDKKDDKNTKSESGSKLYSFLKDDRTRICTGLIIIILCLYVMLSFISFFFTGWEDQSILNAADPGDTLEIKSQIQNWTGLRGARIADFFINRTFGVSCFFMLFFFLLVGSKMLGIRKFRLLRWFVLTSFGLFWVSLFFGFFFIPVYESTFLYLGGEHGYYMSKWLEAQIGWFGTFLVLCTTLLIFMIFAFKATLPFLNEMGMKLKNKFFKGEGEADATLAAEAAETTDQNLEAELLTDGEQPTQQDEQFDITVLDGSQENPEEEENSSSELEEQDNELDNNPDEDEIIETLDPEQLDTKSEPQIFQGNGFEITVPKEEDMVDEPHHDDPTAIDSQPTFDIIVNPDEDYDASEMGPYDPTLDLSNYKYPTFDLLKQFDNNGEVAYNMEEQNANKEKIVQTLENYGIKIDTVKATVGPTVTLYEIVPAPGVRISKIKNLENDIALSLSALGIRIIAPIPGKGTIGIEVPNKDAQIVSMKSVLASKKFQESKYDLPIAFGKTITNEVFVTDLAKMPHLLVAGATGQGKSVGLNAIITSLLYKKHPSQLKFVMVDPKKVEFTVYSNIERHFLAKIPDMDEAIVTDVTKVVETLNSLTKEMDNRYDLLKKARVRNIKEYNERFINRRLNPQHGHRYLPYIVVIIDEFGDLIMTAGKEVELPIARIAQLARAVGIHMVIATQRPTTNIITGTIKANFPARLAFRVASMIDSRTILDAPGANQLIGRGDMLFLQGSDLIRVQCAFVDTPEVERIADYIGVQQGYPTAFMLPEYEGGEGGDSSIGSVDLSKRDPMFDEAAKLIVAEQVGSTSLIQRKFSIGYNRAGRIMDQLEAANIVGPAKGSKAREVMVLDLIQLDMMLSAMNNR